MKRFGQYLPLRVIKAPVGQLSITWETTLASRYDVYRGTIPAGHTLGGRGYDHAAFGACSVTSPSALVDAGSGSFYYLAVARCGAVDGSFGRDSVHRERSPAAPTCP